MIDAYTVAIVVIVVVTAMAVAYAVGQTHAKEYPRERGVPVPRSQLEAQAVIAEVRANLNRHTDKKGRPYESDIVMNVWTGEYLYARYYRGPNGEHEQWEMPFPGRSAERVKAEVERMLESGQVFVYDDDGFRQARPMTADELNDPQRYRGCIPVKS